MRRKLSGIIIIVLGLALLAYPKANELYNTYKQEKLLREWEEALQLVDREQDDTEKEEELALREAEAAAREEKERREAAEREYIEKNTEGVLSIKKINLRLPILRGVSDRNMRITVASMEATGSPGGYGNYVIAGHRNHTYGRNFNRLDELAVGDAVQVDTGVEVFNYIIHEKLYVDPDETWVIYGDEEKREITLITCHPMKNPTQRLILRGEME